MPLNDDQRRTLLTNLARDKAENLRNEISRIIAEAETRDFSHLSEEDRTLGELAMRRALESAQRMVTNLEAAMKLSEEIEAEAREEREPPEERA
jgi:hypothetical protein